MYHFVSEQIAELRLSENVLIASQTTQYLKCFQLEAVRFLFERLSKQEFCIFNDESGLGKCTAVVALLSGLGAAKKSLIVLQNDDQLLAGWQFHLDILTDLNVCVLKDVNDSTESSHSVYLSKWSVLRSIGDLSKLNFDYVIVDHRGHTLNNSFCTSMLLKQYEHKVNIVISSVDLTSDVKLLYNVLRLGGCLEHQHNGFRSFEAKFHLPDVKEVLSKRVDLEEYYKQRGVLGEYIKEFRIRRYRHQFDSYLPLVAPDQYKTNLSVWLGQNNSNSTICASTIDSSSEVRSTGGSDEIFESLMSLRQERQLAQSADSELILLSQPCDDVIAMEPLIFEMSESEIEEVVPDELTISDKKSSTEVVLLSSDDCKIVTPPTTPPHSKVLAMISPTTKPKQKFTKRMRAPKQAELTESETEEQPSYSKRTPKKLNVRLSRILLHQKHDEAPKATDFKKLSNEDTKPSAVASKEKLEQSNTLVNAIASKVTKHPSPEPRSPKKCGPSPITPKTEPRSKRSNGQTSNTVPPRQTRSMQRLTRSADSRQYSKYTAPMIALEYEKKGTTRKRNCDASQTPKSSKRTKQEAVVAKQEATVTPKKSKIKPVDEKPKVKRPKERPPKKILADAQQSLSSNIKKKSSPKIVISAPATTPELLSTSSGSVFSDNSYMQCAQKLPENLAELGSMELPQFRVPHAPQATPLMLPITLNFFSDSEVVVLPSPNQQPDIVMINSSHDESSEHSAEQSQSRRTRALKSKRTISAKEPAQPSTSSFGQLLAQQRGMVNKSPDIFSSCSDLSQVTLAQPVPFEGFKIFGSEVKQLQQQHAKSHTSMLAKKKRGRSCLDILENMFEPHKSKNNEPFVQLLPNLPSPKPHTPQRRFTLWDDDIFEITNNGEFGSRLRLTSSGHVSPVHQPQRNKITNYLISSGGTPEDTIQRSQVSQALRKSPKASKSTQSTKLTRWFGTATTAVVSGESQSAPSTPVVPVEKVTRARWVRSGAAGKRKRLDMNK